MSWDSSISDLKVELEGMHLARETALSASRKIIQTSSKCIKHVHRGQFEEARGFLAEAQALAANAREQIQDYPEVLYAGYLQDAEKEMVEAAGCLALVLNEDVPSPAELGVQARSYLNGMGECSSEMRRIVLDMMREGRIVESEAMLATMVTIYDDLCTFDFPDGLTGGLRKTCDALRAVIERTRSDLTVTKIQLELIEELRNHSSKN